MKQSKVYDPPEGIRTQTDTETELGATEIRAVVFIVLSSSHRFGLADKSRGRPQIGAGSVGCGDGGALS